MLRHRKHNSKRHEQNQYSYNDETRSPWTNKRWHRMFWKSEHLLPCVQHLSPFSKYVLLASLQDLVQNYSVYVSQFTRDLLQTCLIIFLYNFKRFTQNDPVPTLCSLRHLICLSCLARKNWLEHDTVIMVQFQVNMGSTIWFGIKVAPCWGSSPGRYKCYIYILIVLHSHNIKALK